MPKLWERMMAIHDMSGFGHIGAVPGVEHYADRALLLPVDIAVVLDDGEDLDAYLAYLRSADIGPKRVLRVKGRNLIAGLSADPAAIEEMHAHARRGGCLQVFCMTEELEEFFARHGISRRCIHSAPLSIARRMNDKAELRRIAKDCGLEIAFLPHVATRDPRAVMAAVKSFLARPEREAEFVVVKRTNLASGDGLMFIRRDASEAEAEERVREHLREHSWNELTVTLHNELRREEGRHAVLGKNDVRDVEKTAEIVRAMLRDADEHGFVSVGRKNFAGGAAFKIRPGQNFIDDLQQYLMDHCRNEIIVEAGFEHEAFSTQIVVGDDKSFRFLGPTKQIVDRNGHHLGNIMVRFFDGSLAGKGLTREDKITMEAYSLTLTKYAYEQMEGYRDTIGFDFMKRKRDGAVFVLECNGRQTAATYPLAVNAQLEGRIREPFTAPKSERVNWGIVMHNAVPTTARSWGALLQKLGNRLFSGMYGALPFNIRLMKLEKPACGVVAVGESLDAALALMDDVQARLSA